MNDWISKRIIAYIGLRTEQYYKIALFFNLK